MRILAIALLSALSAQAQQPSQPPLGHRHAHLLSVDGLHFKDLNANGKLDPYED